MFKKRTEKSMDTTTATTTTSTSTTLKSKKFPTMFKKMMLSRLKNISKDATSAVKSSVQKRTPAKKKPTVAVPKTVPIERKSEASPVGETIPSSSSSSSPPPPPPLPSPQKSSQKPNVKRPIVQQPQQQQLNSRTYRVKTKDRKSVLSLPEVSKLQTAAAAKVRKSHLPVKVKKPPAPAPPPPRQNCVAPVNNVLADKAECRGYQPDKWTPTAVGSARKKRLVLCYLCGKEFGTASLPFHEPQCLKKWTQENSRLPEHLQRSMPQKPNVQNISVDDWNQLAWEATQSNLVPCEYCQRKFLANRLEAHARVCIESKKKIVPSAPLPKLPAKPTADKPKKKPVPCYVCGRLFGTASIGIHEPQCLIKWTRENENLPPHLRRPEPTKPEVIVDEVTGKVDHQATRDEHWKTYLSQLVPCDLCKRTFNPDRLEVHQKSCKGPTNKNT